MHTGLQQETKQRHIILDALRGLALFGVCMANYSEFSLYSFLGSGVTGAMPTATVDRAVQYLQYIFIDGKFYTLFSLLFGIGFSIILRSAAQKRRNGLTIFYRRMATLFVIGLLHLIFLWAGDILILYAFLGFLLPLFHNVSDKKLLQFAAFFLIFPIAIDAGIQFLGWNFSAPVIRATACFHKMFGITNETFATWLAQKDTYLDVLKFNTAGSFIRMQEFIEGNRAFKVLGLFVLGLYIGRSRLYANLSDNRLLLKKACFYGFLFGIPVSLIYAWSSMEGHPWGLTVHSALYTISVLPLSLAYIGAFGLWYLRCSGGAVFRMLAAPGRMALTNYIMQSVFGMIIFYGIGFGLGATRGLVYVELIAIGVFILQMAISRIWLNKFRYGVLEWGWRMLTYGKRLPIVKKTAKADE
jgi:uncharacterized protein